MKNVKFAVAGASLVAIVSVFLQWISVEGSLPKLLGALPRSGMDNGGPIFIFLLAMPLAAAGIGSLKRFGRGLAVLALLGALAAAFMGLVKYADIEDAAREVKKLGGAATLQAAAGYYLYMIGSTVALLGSLVGLIKPEPAMSRA